MGFLIQVFHFHVSLLEGCNATVFCATNRFDLSRDNSWVYSWVHGPMEDLPPSSYNLKHKRCEFKHQTWGSHLGQLTGGTWVWGFWVENKCGRFGRISGYCNPETDQ